MPNSHLLRVVLLLLAVLPGCVTRAIWGDALRTSGRTEHTLDAAVSNGTAYVSRDGTAFLLAVELPEKPPLPCVLRPHPGNKFSMAEVLQLAREQACWLTFVHELPHPDASASWTALLQAGPPDSGERLVLALQVQPDATDYGQLLTGASPLPLASVNWRTVEWVQSEVDYLGIAWRVAATPFTVTADAVMHLPAVVTNCIAGSATVIALPILALVRAATS